MMAPKITWNIVVALLELLLLVELELFPVTLPVVLEVFMVVPGPGLVGAGTVHTSSDSGLVRGAVGAVLNLPVGQALQVFWAL